MKALDCSWTLALLKIDCSWTYALLKMFAKLHIIFKMLHMLYFALYDLSVGISLDLSDACNNLCIADSIGHLFIFEIDGACYQHVGLPMG